MELPVCTPEQSILESELKRAASHEAVGEVKVIETPHGFYVKFQINYRKRRDCYLTTRRFPDQPRLFRDLNRLNTHLRTLAPASPVTLYRQGMSEW